MLHSHMTCVLALQGKKEIAKALRVFVDEENYPVLVHCIHGKDRTGLIVMLIMLLCSVEPEVGTSLGFASDLHNLETSHHFLCPSSPWR